MKRPKKLFAPKKILRCALSILISIMVFPQAHAASSTSFILSSGGMSGTSVDQSSSESYIANLQVTTTGSTASATDFQTVPAGSGGSSSSSGDSSGGSGDSSSGDSSSGGGGGSSGGTAASTDSSDNITETAAENTEESSIVLKFGASLKEILLEAEEVQKKKTKELNEAVPETYKIKKVLKNSAESQKAAEIEEEPAKLHQSAGKSTSTIRTIDSTPVLQGELGKNKTYKLILRDSDGKVLETKKITTDQNGKFTYETQVTLPSGSSSQIQIVDQRDETDIRATYNFEVVAKKAEYLDLKINSFGDKENLHVGLENAVEQALHIGEIERTTAIDGYATPFAEIVAYFQKRDSAPTTKAALLSYFEKDELIIIKTKADQDGYFEIEIPAKLSAGDHSVRISQVFPDGTVSADLQYDFSLVTHGTSSSLSIWLVVLIMAVLVKKWKSIVRLTKAFSSKYKNKKHK